jgi:hypothetical protein
VDGLGGLWWVLRGSEEGGDLAVGREELEGVACRLYDRLRNHNGGVCKW